MFLCFSLSKMLTSRINVSLLIGPPVRNLDRCTILTAYISPVSRKMALRTVAKEPWPSLNDWDKRRQVLAKETEIEGEVVFTHSCPTS